MPKPRVSIGMPLYNAHRYLREALDSLLAQTFTDFEIVISDNASTDDTAGICREYAARDARIQYHRNDKNLGVVANFNRVFELSTGEYFKWAAYDDLHVPAYLARCVEALEEHPHASIAHSHTRSIDDDGLDRGEFPAQHRLDATHGPERFRRMLDTDAFPPIWGLMRSQLIRRTNLHGYYMGSDRAFMAEMVLMGTVVYVPQNLFLLREHAGSYTSSVKDYYQRLSWYAPGRRIPSWAQFPMTAWGFASAIRRAPVSWSEKVACTRHLAGWIGGSLGKLIKRKLSRAPQSASQVAMV